jgi:hypothetical protein
MGLNSTSSFKYYFATDYMQETVLSAYCLLFIYTPYLYKLDVSKNIFLLNSQNNNIAISSELMNTESAENCPSTDSLGCFAVLLVHTSLRSMNRALAPNFVSRDKGFSETTRQLPDTEEYKF